MEKEKDGVWRTIRGRRIFIASGESLGQAMSKSDKFNNQMSRVKKNKDKYDIIQKAKNFDKDLKKTNRERYDIDKSHEKDKWEEQEKYKARHNTKEAQRYEKNEYKKMQDYKAKKQSNNHVDNEKLKSDKMNATMEKRQKIIEDLDNKTRDLSDYDKYNLAVSKLENEDYKSATERQYWVGTRDRYVENAKTREKEIDKQSNNRVEEKKWEVKSTGGFGQQYGEGNIPIRDGHVDYESHFGALAQDLTLLSNEELNKALSTQQELYNKYSNEPRNYDARTRNGKMHKIIHDSELTNAKLSVEALKKEAIRRENERRPQYKGTDYEVKYYSVEDVFKDPNSKINQYLAKKRSNRKNK